MRSGKASDFGNTSANGKLAMNEGGTSKAAWVWDPFIRIFHWSLVVLFLGNAFVTDDDSKLHEWVGYGVLVLIGLRIIWGFVGPRRARFSSFRPSVQGALFHLRNLALGEVHAQVTHNPVGALMVYNLLGTLILIGVTGYMMTTTMFWGYEWVEELHEFLTNWALFSIVFHVGGVFFESRRTGVNLVAKMTLGAKKNENS